VHDVGKFIFGEVGFSRDNRLKQNKMRSPAIGQLWVSG
jgi:hypothetical protein